MAHQEQDNSREAGEKLGKIPGGYTGFKQGAHMVPDLAGFAAILASRCEAWPSGRSDLIQINDRASAFEHFSIIEKLIGSAQRVEGTCSSAF
ncbi:MAG: hypothetical protein HY765_00375 [Rhodomicrobium sp.]|nr:hypothetical protein [Rhodomicrobium sp.]